MDTKGSSLHVKTESQPTIPQDSSLHQQAAVDSRNEKCREDVFVPGSSYRKHLNELGPIAPLAMMVAEKLSNEQPAPPSVQAPTYYSTSRGQIYAFKPEGGMQIGSSDPSYQSFTISTSDAPQPGPVFVQCHALSGDGTRYCAPANKVVFKAATGDVSAYQICSPATSLPKGVAMASSPGPLQSSQQLGEEASRKRELRLMKNREAARECRRKKKEYVKCLENRVAVLENQNKTLIEELKALKDLQAAKECRRRKREYVNCLEAHVSALELQNKKLMEELKYLKGICAEKSS